MACIGFEDRLCYAVKVKMLKKSTSNINGEDLDVSGMKSWNSDDMENIESFSKSHEESSLIQMFRDTVHDVQDFFSEDKRPLRGMWDSFKSAFSIAWDGYYRGFETLVFDYPWRGMNSDGPIGWFSGIGLGVLHFGAMTSSGIISGMYQVSRGVECTYKAIASTSCGMRWDKSKGWFYYSLDLETTEIRSKPIAKPKRHLRKQVKDRNYYNLLKVKVDATPSEIKRAYYQQALEIHPDKNKRDETDVAADHFRTLNNVYKTLITSESRDLYDLYGKHYPEKKVYCLFVCCELSYIGEYNRIPLSMIIVYLFRPMLY
jgi:hypothetical protein